MPRHPPPCDLARQIAVISALGFTLVAVLVGVGGLGGTEVENSQGGQLSAQGSYLAPAGPAFSIWSVIYLGLIGYAVWQALPGQRASERQRAVGLVDRAHDRAQRPVARRGPAAHDRVDRRSSSCCC